jgi:hypothetical protein
LRKKDRMANTESKIVVEDKDAKTKVKFFIFEVKQDENKEIISFSPMSMPEGVASNEASSIKEMIKQSVLDGEPTYKGKRIAVLRLCGRPFHIGPKPDPEMIIIED